MSLQVWLPLNGNLLNKGLSNAIITNTNATINNSGKMGKCYNFAKNAYLDINKEVMTNFTSASVCFWVKINSWNTNWDTIFQAGLGTAPWTSYIFGVLRNQNNSLCFTISNGTSATNGSYRTDNLEIGKWTHVTCTYGNSKCRTYLNGVLCHEYTSTIVPNFSGITSIKIGGLVGNYKCDCDLNDFRLYDHVLSIKEIKELSKGLVLHYPLSDKYIEPTTNLCNGLKQGGRTTVSNNTIINTGENADTYWYIIPKLAVIGGETYTVSCKLTGFSSDDLYIRWGVCSQSGTNCAGYWNTYNGYNEFTFTMPMGLDGSTANIIFDDRGGTRTLVFTISDIQLEKKDHATPYTPTSRNETTIYDCSGYLNNGTLFTVDGTGSFLYEENSPRYLYATNIHSLNTTTATRDGAAYIRGKCELQTPSLLTITFWCYARPEGYCNSTTQGLFCTTNLNPTSPPEGADYKTSAMNHRDSAVDTNNSAGTLHLRLRIDLISNEWHYYSFTYDGQNAKSYRDGILQDTKSFSSATALGSFINVLIGFSNAGGVYRSNNHTYSDFRVYTTALSAEDIALLYHTSALADRNSNFYTSGSYIEDDLIKITHSGNSFSLLINENPNYFSETPGYYSPTSYGAYNLTLLENLQLGQTYTILLWDVDVSHSAKTEAQLGVWIYWGGGNVALGSWAGPTYFTNGHADYLSKTITITSTQASGSGATNSFLVLYNSVSYVAGTMNMSVGKWKITKGGQENISDKIYYLRDKSLHGNNFILK